MDIKKIKQLRERTGAGIVDCKKALEEAKGDLEKAQKLLRKKGYAQAAKKKDRTTAEGSVVSYIHAGGKVGSLVEINCETDFVARTDEFKELTAEIAMQVAAMNPRDVKELLAQDYIRDTKKTINDLIQETIAKLGENIQIARLERLALGE